MEPMCDIPDIPVHGIYINILPLYLHGISFVN